MPLQQISLDQSIYNKRKQMPMRSPISQALTPQRTAGVSGSMPQGEGFIEREQRLQEEAEARKFQEKMMKLQHEQEMEKLKFAAGLNEDAKKYANMKVGDMLGGEVAQPQASEQQQTLTKENMPEAAMEMWKFISTLDPESQKFYIQKLKEKEQPKGSYIEAGGKRMEMPGSLGMYGYLVDGGFIDPATDTVIKKTATSEKGTWQYNDKDNLMVNTATGETVPVKGMEGIDHELIKDAYNYGSTYMGRLTEPTLLEKITPENMSAYMDNAREESKLATMNYLLGQGVSKKEAKDIAYSIPIGERGKVKKEPPPEGGGGTTEPPEVDKITVENLRKLEKDNPGAIEANRKAYEDRYGVEEVRMALGEKEKEKKKITTKTTEGKEKEEEKEKGKEKEKESTPKKPKVKDYFKKWSPL